MTALAADSRSTVLTTAKAVRRTLTATGVTLIQRGTATDQTDICVTGRGARSMEYKQLELFSTSSAYDDVLALLYNDWGHDLGGLSSREETAQYILAKHAHELEGKIKNKVQYRRMLCTACSSTSREEARADREYWNDKYDTE